MKPLSFHAPWLGVLIVAGVALSSPVIASAQDCAVDADCGAGYRCQTDSYESCGGAIMCSADGGCTETDGGCVTSSYSWCTNAICTTDADCPGSMACQAQTTWVCDDAMGAAGGGGSGSSDAGGSTCTEEPADSICIPRYQLPCSESSDCGGGFDCVQGTYWVCDGGMAGAGSATDGGASIAGAGGSSPTMDADAGVDPGGGYDCHEEPSPEHSCVLQDLPCGADADCPEGLSCRDQYVWTCNADAGAPIAGAGGTAPVAGSGGMATGGSMASDADGGGSDTSQCMTEVQQRCMPPQYMGGGGAGAGGTTGGSGSGTGGSAGSMGPPSSDAGIPSGEAGAGGTGSGDDDGESDEHDHGHHFGWLKLGCSAGGPIGGDPLGWLALGLVTLVMRRRARGLG